MSDEDLAAVSEHLHPGVRSVLTVQGSLASRSALGGTAPVRVTEQRAHLLKEQARLRHWVEDLPVLRS